MVGDVKALGLEMRPQQRAARFAEEKGIGIVHIADAPIKIATDDQIILGVDQTAIGSLAGLQDGDAPITFLHQELSGPRAVAHLPEGDHEPPADGKKDAGSRDHADGECKDNGNHRLQARHEHGSTRQRTQSQR